MHRFSRRSLAVCLSLTLLTSFFAASPTLASIGPCASGGKSWSGEQLGPMVAHGAEAKIEKVVPHLCAFTGSPYMSFMSAWVALVANSPFDSNNDDIFQIGYIQCSVNGPGCPTGVHSYVWAYGREVTTTCGARIPPSAHFLGATDNALHTYDVYLHGSAIGNQYSVYIDGSAKNSQSATALDDCWIGGPKFPEYEDEAANVNDQLGGTTANPQDWTGVKYKESSTWKSMNATGSCLVHQNGSKCTGSGSTFKVWDPRL